MTKNGPEFLIGWRDFPLEKDDTWEPKTNLTGSEHMIISFFHSYNVTPPSLGFRLFLFGWKQTISKKRHCSVFLLELYVLYSSQFHHNILYPRFSPFFILLQINTHSKKKPLYRHTHTCFPVAIVLSIVHNKIISTCVSPRIPRRLMFGLLINLLTEYISKGVR
jgi:hypothetical protein